MGPGPGPWARVLVHGPGSWSMDPGPGPWAWVPAHGSGCIHPNLVEFKDGILKSHHVSLNLRMGSSNFPDLVPAGPSSIQLGLGDQVCQSQVINRPRCIFLGVPLFECVKSVIGLAHPQRHQVDLLNWLSFFKGMYYPGGYPPISLCKYI